MVHPLLLMQVVDIHLQRMARHLQATDVLTLMPLHMQATRLQAVLGLRLPTICENLLVQNMLVMVVAILMRRCLHHCLRITVFRHQVTTDLVRDLLPLE